MHLSLAGHGSIDGAYVDGVSVTYSTPHNHIWMFAGDWTEIIHINSNNNYTIVPIQILPEEGKGERERREREEDLKVRG